MLTKEVFGTHEGIDYTLFILKNNNGVSVNITELGAIITSVKIPVNGQLRECVLGFDDIADYFSTDYLENYPYLGAVIGRNAGRVSHGKIKIGEQPVQLTQNKGGHHLHGGSQGFDRQFWDVENFGENSITLTYHSEDGEEGYPGNLTARVIYTLTDNNELKVEFEAEADADTVTNLTQHTYFNLNGGNFGDILSHQIQINASNYVPLDEFLLPKGEILPVEGSEYDYRALRHPDSHLDVSFPINPSSSPAGILVSPDQKLTMEVKTTQPVLHIYAGYYILNKETEGRKTLQQNAGICFETQGFADAPNHEAFLSTVLKRGEKYHHTTTFKFIF